MSSWGTVGAQRRVDMSSAGKVTRKTFATISEQSSHTSFIRDFLQELSKALTSDCAVGGVQNEIRARVIEILNKANGTDTDAHAGRSALEARFALGHDPDQYINMAVAPLWVAFDVDEVHQIVETPPEVRAASAVGMIKAFDELIANREHAAKKELREAVAVLSWLMECDEIADVFRGMPGMATVSKETLLDDIAKNDYTNVEALLGMLYTLLDTSSEETPMSLSLKMELENVERLAHGKNDDMERMLSAFLIMGPDVEKWCKADKFAPSVSTVGETNPSTTEPVVDSSDDASDVETWCETPAQVSDVDMGKALAAAYAAVSYLFADTNKQNVADGWKFEGGLSPFWDFKLDWEEFLNTIAGDSTNESYQARVGSNMNQRRMVDLLKRKMAQARLGALTGDGLFDEGGEKYVAYALVRGITGLRGPHEMETASEKANNSDVLRYTFPTSELGADLAKMHTDQIQHITESSMHSALTMEERALRSESERTYDSMQISNVTDFDIAVAAIENELDRRINEEAVVNTMRDSIKKLMDSSNQEVAMQAHWGPVRSFKQAVDADYSPFGIALSKACTQECLIHTLSLFINRENFEGDARQEQPVDKAQMNTFRAMRASTKLRQLESLAYIAQLTNPNLKPSAKAKNAETTATLDTFKKKRVFVTRPPISCRPNRHEIDELLIPVDAGLAVFNKTEETNASYVLNTLELPDDMAKVKVPTCTPTDLQEAGVVTQNLRNGIGGGDGPDGDSKDLELCVTPAPVQTPYLASAARSPRVMYNHKGVDADALTPKHLMSAARHGLGALKKLRALQSEGQLLQRLKLEGSDERKQLFGLHEQGSTVDRASRDRRATMWDAALREVAVSTDRLLVFVKTLAGFLGEQPDGIVVAGDPELIESQRLAEKRQRDVAARAMQMQSTIVSTVLGAALKQSNLSIGIDATGHDVANQKLVVVDAEAREQFQKLANGTSGRPFFDATVSLQNLAEGKTPQTTVASMLRQLDEIGTQFHRFLSNEYVAGGTLARASPETLGAPHNSYLVRLKPEAFTAIRRAYQMLVREIQIGHYHVMVRIPTLWECIEGRDGQLVTTFANLCADTLQNIRMTSTALSAYVGDLQLRNNRMQLKMTLQRTVSVVCSYVMSYETPRFLEANGRERYFGGKRPRDDDDDDQKKSVTPDHGPKAGEDGSEDKHEPPRRFDVIRKLSKKEKQILENWKQKARNNRRNSNGQPTSVPGGSGYFYKRDSSKKPQVVVPEQIVNLQMQELQNSINKLRKNDQEAYYATLKHVTRKAKALFNKQNETAQLAENSSDANLMERIEEHLVQRQWTYQGNNSNVFTTFVPPNKETCTSANSGFCYILTGIPNSVTDGSNEADVSVALNNLFDLGTDATWTQEGLSSENTSTWKRPVLKNEEEGRANARTMVEAVAPLVQGSRDMGKLQTLPQSYSFSMQILPLTLLVLYSMFEAKQDPSSEETFWNAFRNFMSEFSYYLDWKNFAFR